MDNDKAIQQFSSHAVIGILFLFFDNCSALRNIGFICLFLTHS